MYANDESPFAVPQLSGSLWTSMTPEQEARFRQRSNAIRDKHLSHGAARLFVLLDDESWGHDGVSLKQSEIGSLIGLDVRQVKRLIRELIGARYVNARHLMSGNVYDFNIPKTALSEVSKMSPRKGQKSPNLQICTRNNKFPLIPAGGGPHCEVCKTPRTGSWSGGTVGGSSAVVPGVWWEPAKGRRDERFPSLRRQPAACSRVTEEGRWR